MIKTLDCTLRDGGYVNDWEFGEENILKIVKSLSECKVNFIELGFVKENAVFNENRTTQNNIDGLNRYVVDSPNIGYVCMINYGECDIDKIPNRSDTKISGIRVTFKKNQVDDALKYAMQIKQKGYNVFIQPMVCVSYSDLEFIDLINKVNKLNPFAFYIVDSFGEMNEQDLIRYFFLAENNLNNGIFLGFHSHNNLQLSYSNCKTFVNFKTRHNLIVDCSILGMGRGAGNLNTEIFLEYLNTNFSEHYNINPIIDVIDKVIANIYTKHFWGYSIPFYISAKNHCHPNYASYLDDKKSLTFFDIDKLLKSLPADKRLSFDKTHIEKIYKEYQERNEYSKEYDELKNEFYGKKVLLIAPGSSYKKYIDDIKKSKHEYILVSVNFIPKNVSIDYSFVSNVKRFSLIEEYDSSRMITTSNIVDSKAKYIISYYSLINDMDNISDNAGMMAINLMIKLGVKSISLAGFDGYSKSPETDYADEYLQLAYYENNQYLNALINQQLKKYSEVKEINFFTSPIFLKV